MQFNLRKLTKNDAEAYKELRMMGFQESSTSFSESFEDEQGQTIEFFESCMGTESEHFSVGCFLANQIIAIATFKRDKRTKARHKSYIHTMYVDPNFRGKQIASKILDYLIEEARMLPDLEQIHLWVLNPKTSAARKLYLKNNFIPQGLVVHDDLKIDGSYVDAEYMTLKLK